MINNSNNPADHRLPLLALRGLVLFPGMTLHFDVGRKKSILALNAAMGDLQEIFLVAQRDVRIDDPTPQDLYEIGVIAKIKQVLRMPGDNIRIVVEGVRRARIEQLVQVEPYFVADLRLCRERRSMDLEYAMALIREAQEGFSEYAELSGKTAPDVVMEVMAAEEPGYLADYIAFNIMLKTEEKQMLLSDLMPFHRLESLIALLRRENDVLELEHQIQERVQSQMDQNQREYYLREQLKVIAQELGDGDNPQEEAEVYRDRIQALNLPEETADKLTKEAGRLFKMPSGSHEASVIRSYLDTCLDLPWNKATKDHIDLTAARRILDRDHYGMEKVKERILEILAVRKLAPDVKGQIICLAGPPGVGKTSIAKSVAKALGRKYVRLSLGGVKDEADIRGHRKTYIGAMPGRIISAIHTAGVNNPLILLDEVDKLANDFRGDPSAALLEVLDSEQNNTFRDHYIEVPFDLSHVLFLTTANDVGAIPGPLYDRMEIIRLGSYTQEEKFHIAKEHLIPQERKRHGLNGRTLKFDDAAIHDLIGGYTREAGVRGLNREIASLCRKAAKIIAGEEAKSVSVTSSNLEELLGPKRFRRENDGRKDEVGVVTGLAWTSVGGETMPVEVAVMDGVGKVELTGSLGNVMKESARAAVSYIRAHADVLGVERDFYKTKDIHIHVPEGAVPKDGPSAGVTITTALVSALTGIPVKGDVAMTGEITLRGRVIPIGGLKEKTMAALRSGIKTVVIPMDNQPDLAELSDTVRENLHFVPADRLETVLETALTVRPQPIKPKEKKEIATIPAGQGASLGGRVESPC
ncbi:Lon protease 1 [Eubacteriaceae bacterium CHKCI005]|uniref:Lon protease n=1 Tax=Solibaculum mannosilyticum TaxID=2780922 RepID=A0A7I8D8X4_9FIRM|nr:endopeptidase La [Solibaculum mannosilyticum]BCI61084.1 Lon protease [Solibaculum mannosilyticum]CZT55596.1 Lon protease 1 [Eubacteriaceae bacterium CHKCI005]